VVFKSPRGMRQKDSGWFPCSTFVAQGALTVAGQWRNLTAFPNILAMIVVDLAAGSNKAADDVMESISTTSTFITDVRHHVKRREANGKGP